MIGLFLAVLIIILLILFVLKIIFEQTDLQTWLNILIITVILFTVVLSIYIVLNKVNTPSNNTKTQITKEETVNKNLEEVSSTQNNKEIAEDKFTKPSAIKPQKDVAEMTNDELSLMLAEKYLTIKSGYEKEHIGDDGANYAKLQIIDEYDLTKEEWDDLYDKLVQHGYIEKAAKNLNLGVDYLIKTESKK